MYVFIKTDQSISQQNKAFDWLLKNLSNH